MLGSWGRSRTDAAIAQLVERLICNQQVGSSILSGGSPSRKWTSELRHATSMKHARRKTHRVPHIEELAMRCRSSSTHAGGSRRF